MLESERIRKIGQLEVLNGDAEANRRGDDEKVRK